MALLNSEKIRLGQPVKNFNLPSVDGKTYTLESFKGSPVLVVMFICNHCPYVKAVEDRLIRLNAEYVKKGVQFVGICSNDYTDYPDDSPQNLFQRWAEKKYGFPYLIDTEQSVARAFGAVCTPDIFVYDSGRKLVYHGRIDDSWKEPSQVERHELREALDALLAGTKPEVSQHPSMGCSIKWKK